MLGHELTNNTVADAPSETWMVGDPGLGTVYFTDGANIILASTRYQVPEVVRLTYTPSVTTHRLLLKPGVHTFTEARFDRTWDVNASGSRFGQARWKDYGGGDGGFVGLTGADWSAWTFPWVLQVPSNAGGGEGYVLDLPCTPPTGGVATAFLLKL